MLILYEGVVPKLLKINGFQNSFSVVSLPVSKYVQRTAFQKPFLILSNPFTSLERELKLNTPKPFASLENHHHGICVHFSSLDFASFPTY